MKELESHAAPRNTGGYLRCSNISLSIVKDKGMKRHQLFWLLSAEASSAFAADSTSEQLGKAVEASVKEMAFYDDAALGASAAELMSRKLGAVAEASKIQSNLTLMQANKCLMPRDPINPRVYSQSAFACVHATPRPGNTPVPECDREKWTKRVQ